METGSKEYILAIHAGHNASVCIGDKSGIRFAIQEERLTGEKNYWGLPEKSLDACLEAVGISPNEVSQVVYGSTQVFCRRHTREDVLKSYQRQDSLAGKIRQRVAVPLAIALSPNYGQSDIKEFLQRKQLENTPLTFYDHHMCHAATAYFGLRKSKPSSYLVLTCDGDGDGLSATVSVMQDDKHEIISKSPWASSLGALYSWTTYIMGFVPLEHEYKLMGMAPYASDSSSKEAAKVFSQYLGLDTKTGLKFEKLTRQGTSGLIHRLRKDLQGMRFDWICSGLQKFTEDILAEWVENAVNQTGVSNVVAAGGVFMNVKANKKIAELQCVDSFEAFPSCGDETLPLGAYYLQAAKRFGSDSVASLNNFYLGDDINESEAEEVIKASGFSYERPKDISKAVADILIAGHPIARCAGRMEFGARALGNRSILADPNNQDVVRVINQMVKKRDFWMPFAPMMLSERQHDYVENPKNLSSPYMMMTFDTKENFGEFIAAVHNADLTCRAQILSEDLNPEMHAILKSFETETGRGVILNTSFNIHGLPIVRTPEDAIYVMKNSGLNYLQLGPFIVKKA